MRRHAAGAYKCATPTVTNVLSGTVSPRESSPSSRLDMLARIVSSENFAVAFLWWAVLVAVAPACFICALGFHLTGAWHVALAVGVVGVAIALVSVLRLASVTVSLRGLAAA